MDRDAGKKAVGWDASGNGKMISGRCLLSICVDRVENRDCSGKMWHQYSRDAVVYKSTVEMLTEMEELFDKWDFPQRSTRSRSFNRIQEKQTPVGKREEVERKMDEQEFQNKRGDKGTFIVHVKFRQNATWQGEVIWAEKKKKQYFRSALELLKLIDGALDETAEKQDSDGEGEVR